jgi:hypothetical protein
MRHSAGRTAGVSRPRPYRHVRSVALVVAAIHATLIVWAWQQTEPRKAQPAPKHVAMLLVMPRAAAPTPAPAPQPAPQPAVARKTVRPDRPPGPAPRGPAPPAEPVTGVALAPPTIASPGSSTPSRWMNPPPAPVPMPPPTQMVHAQSAHEAVRAQLAAALQHELGRWQALTAADDGHCRLAVEGDSGLACDNEMLLQVLAPREGVLAALLASYRSLEPRAHGLTIALAQGRYQAAWDLP